MNPLYLDLLKRTLINSIYPEADHDLQCHAPVNEQARIEGMCWSSCAHTMIGLKRLDNLQYAVETALQNRIPGDLMETGVWRGGATIFMRAILQAYGAEDRSVWVADSFRGLPPSNAAQYPADAALDLSGYSQLAVSLEAVKANFARYGLLDRQVKFLEGWFRDTLPTAPVERLAVLRLDGDLYESTMDALANLYDKVSPAGFVIIDDYGCIPACKQAVTDFRTARGITDHIWTVDWSCVYWRKTACRGTL